MGFNSFSETSNYNYEAGNKGYIYKPVTKFIRENEDILSNEQIKKIDINMVSLEAFENITPEMKQDFLEYTQYMEDLKQRRMQNITTQTYGRSM